MQNSNGHQKGPQDHAEGQHGEKTHKKIIEQLQSGRTNGAPVKPVSEHRGAHRLESERQQHDVAEKRSEKTRLAREIDRHRSTAERPRGDIP